MINNASNLGLDVCPAICTPSQGEIAKPPFSWRFLLILSRISFQEI
jgi:hypothetical protein